jgi:hypothetical protein
MIHCRLIGCALIAAVFACGAVQAQGIRAVRLAGSSEELLHGQATFWKNAPVTTVAMTPQSIIVPRVKSAAVKELKVRAVHNNQWMAFLIEWTDASQSDRIVVDNFGDQVAMQLPVTFNKDALPSPMMGNPGGRVSIMQWRAAFQRDLDVGEPQVRDLYPNAHSDVYPDQVLRVTDVRPYMGAVGLDNPISHPNRTPVLDQMAEGWGTMTVKPEQHADGKGLWSQGRWRVVIAHPLASGDANDPQLAAGDETVAAFAVWEGGTREVGSRKAWSNWVPVKFE